MKIINRFINAGKQIAENRPLELPQIKINQEDDIIQLSSKKKKAKNSTPSGFAKTKELIKSKMVHIAPPTVKELEKADLGEFLAKSQSVISEGIGIPKGLYARIFPAEPAEIGRAAMYYDWASNRIAINIEILNKSKSILFSGLRHEIEHQKQAFDVFRTEGLGDEAVKYFAKLQTDGAIEVNEAMTLKEIQEINLDFSKRYEQYRQKIVEKMGIIPANSPQAKIAGEYFEGAIKNLDSPESFKTAIGTLHEQEAYFAGIIGRIEYLAAKWFNK